MAHTKGQILALAFRYKSFKFENVPSLLGNGLLVISPFCGIVLEQTAPGAVNRFHFFFVEW